MESEHETQVEKIIEQQNREVELLRIAVSEVRKRLVDGGQGIMEVAELKLRLQQVLQQMKELHREELDDHDSISYYKDSLQKAEQEIVELKNKHAKEITEIKRKMTQTLALAREVEGGTGHMSVPTSYERVLGEVKEERAQYLEDLNLLRKLCHLPDLNLSSAPSHVNVPDAEILSVVSALQNMVSIFSDLQVDYLSELRSQAEKAMSSLRRELSISGRSEEISKVQKSHMENTDLILERFTSAYCKFKEHQHSTLNTIRAKLFSRDESMDVTSDSLVSLIRTMVHRYTEKTSQLTQTLQDRDTARDALNSFRLSVEASNERIVRGFNDLRTDVKRLHNGVAGRESDPEDLKSAFSIAQGEVCLLRSLVDHYKSHSNITADIESHSSGDPSKVFRRASTRNVPGERDDTTSDTASESGCHRLSNTSLQLGSGKRCYSSSASSYNSGDLNTERDTDVPRDRSLSPPLSHLPSGGNRQRCNGEGAREKRRERRARGDRRSLSMPSVAHHKTTRLTSIDNSDLSPSKLQAQRRDCGSLSVQERMRKFESSR